MPISIGKLIMSIIISTFVLGILATILLEWGNPATAISFGVTANAVNGTTQSKVFNPLQGTVTGGVNQSNNLAQANQLFGFAFAFILPNFGQFITSIIQLPIIFNSLLITLLSGVGIVGLPLGLILSAIETIVMFYLLLTAVQVFMKSPPIW